MDRETEGISDAIDVLKELFAMPAPREAKCRTLFRLARRSTGVILELGTFHGNGFIALSLGAKPEQRVMTMDDYAPKKGWAGEIYGPKDREIFYKNCDKASVVSRLLLQSAKDGIEFWKKFDFPQVGLLFWDLGQNNVAKTMNLWEPNIAPGGILAMHDTYTNLFGAADYIGKLCQEGLYKDYEVMDGGVHVAVKA